MERKKRKLDHSDDQAYKPITTSASDTTVVGESSSRDQDSDGNASTQTDNHPPDDSNPLGTLTEITIHNEYNSGYLVSAKLGQELLGGVIFPAPDEQRDLSSQAEGLSTEVVADTSNQASLHQSSQPHIDLNQPPVSPVLPAGLDQPGSSSDPLRTSLEGTIDKRVDGRYFVTVKSGQTLLNGILYRTSDKEHAPLSQAEDIINAVIAATSNEASSSQSQPQSELQEFLDTLTLPKEALAPQKPILQPSDLYAGSAPEWNMLPTFDEAQQNLLLTQDTLESYTMLQPYSDSLYQVGSSSYSVFDQAKPDDSINLPTADSHQGGSSSSTNVLPETAFQGGENTSLPLMQSQPIPFPNFPMQETQTMPSTGVVSSLQTGTSTSGSGPGSTSGNTTVDESPTDHRSV